MFINKQNIGIENDTHRYWGGRNIKESTSHANVGIENDTQQYWGGRNNNLGVDK